MHWADLGSSASSRRLHSSLVLGESGPPEQQGPVQGHLLADFPRGTLSWPLGELLGLGYCLQAPGHGSSWDQAVENLIPWEEGRKWLELLCTNVQLQSQASRASPPWHCLPVSSTCSP